MTAPELKRPGPHCVWKENLSPEGLSCQKNQWCTYLLPNVADALIFRVHSVADADFVSGTGCRIMFKRRKSKQPHATAETSSSLAG
jgi:hypothetical protein